jgi:site-specific recombinase XerD
MKRKERGVQEWPPGSGRFRIDYYDAEGRRHREMVGSEKLAISVYRQRKTEIWEGRFQPKPRGPRLSFRDLALARMEAKRQLLAPRSHRTDELRLKPILEVFGGTAAAAITPAALESFLADLRADGASGSTVNRYRSLLSSIFAHAVRSGKIASNPVGRVERYPEGEARIRFLDAGEERALRAVIGAQSEEHEAEFDLALNTGLRRGEQYGLTWDRVDLERGLLTVDGKTGRRHVPISSAARVAIEKLWRSSNGSRFVCPDKQRDDQLDWRRWFEEACITAKVDNFRWHDLRHTFASRLVMKGVDLTSVQKLLGHRSILTTQRYAHLSLGHLQSAVEKLVDTSMDTPKPSRAKKLLKVQSLQRRARSSAG